MPAISNTSPLILYNRIGRLHLLRELYGEIVIPDAVRAEILVGGRDRAESMTFLAEPWVLVERVDIASDMEVFRLDAGELEVLSLARQREWDDDIILDDPRGRRTALRLGFEPVGSAGVLVLCKDAGIIDAVAPLLDELRGAGLRLSDEVYRRILRNADEYE